MPACEALCAGGCWLIAKNSAAESLPAEGVSATSIADQLLSNPKTVENHPTNIMHELELRGLIDRVKCAARVGVINIESWADSDQPVRGDQKRAESGRDFGSV